MSWLAELIAWIGAEILGQETGNSIERLRINKWAKIIISLILVIVLISIIYIFSRV